MHLNAPQLSGTPGPARAFPIFQHGYCVGLRRSFTPCRESVFLEGLCTVMGRRLGLGPSRRPSIWLIGIPRWRPDQARKAKNLGGQRNAFLRLNPVGRGLWVKQIVRLRATRACYFRGGVKDGGGARMVVPTRWGNTAARGGLYHPSCVANCRVGA